MSDRLGGFVAGQNVNIAIGTFTAVTSPTFTFASSEATPAIGQAVQFTTTGTLPTGLSINTTYYVVSVSTNTCQFSTALGGSAVTFTNSSGSGTHTAVTQRAFNPYAGAPNAIEYLVVAGGGAGAGTYSDTGGGGGAGGLLQGSNYSVTPALAYAITVGAGGVGVNVFSGQAGASGSNSVFGSLTAIGGGGGGSDVAALTGGSGGGGGSSPGLGTLGQGNSGGYRGSGYSGGGGGAGSAGMSGSAALCGNGGAGLCSTITGQRVFYAGGGGGGSENNSGVWGGLGTAGGGNAGYPDNGGLGNGTPGLSNTGGGGGGGSKGAGGSPIGGSGGSGIVVIRYPQINAAPAMVTGSPQVRYTDGYQIYIWTSSGSIIF